MLSKQVKMHSSFINRFFIFENVRRLSYKSMIKDLVTVNFFSSFCLCYETLISFLLGYVMLSPSKIVSILLVMLQYIDILLVMLYYIGATLVEDLS